MSDVAKESPRVMSDAIGISIERQIDKSIEQIVDRIVSKRLEKSLVPVVDQSVTEKIDAAIDAHAKHKHPNRESHYEKVFENRLIFGSRWLLAPAYLFLVCALIILLYQALVETVQLARTLVTSGFNEVPILI